MSSWYEMMVTTYPAGGKCTVQLYCLKSQLLLGLLCLITPALVLKETVKNRFLVIIFVPT